MLTSTASVSKKAPPPSYYRETKPTEDWTCPSSGENFSRLCPVTACPARLSAQMGRLPNCAYLILGTPNLDKYRLAYIFKDTPENAEIKIKKGRERIRQALFVARLVETHLIPPKYTCPTCAMTKKFPGVCLNARKCASRIKLTTRLLKKFPFNVPLLHMNAQKILQFGHAIPTIKTIYSPLMAKTSTSFDQMIGLRRSTLKRLELLSAIPTT